jgi:predicted DNA-binding protein
MTKRNTKQRSIHLTETDIERADYLSTNMEMSFSAMVRALIKGAYENMKDALTDHNKEKAHG